MVSKKWLSDAMRGFWATILAFALLASFVPMDAVAAEVGHSWKYVNTDPCKDYDVDEEEASKTDGSQAEPGGDGSDVWTEGSRENLVAKEVFDTLTGTYGWSGYAAAGVLGNTSCEGGFCPDAGEWAGGSLDGMYGCTRAHVHFGMDSKSEPANFKHYGGSIGPGGGGLFQFTPYTKFTDSNYWGKLKPEGWAAANQIAFMVEQGGFASRSVELYMKSTNPFYGAALYGVTPIYTTVEEYCSSDNASDAALMFQVGYERGAVWAMQATMAARKDNAEKFAVMFDAASHPADPEKWKEWLGNPSGDITIDTSSTTEEEDDCEALQNGEVDTSMYLDLARQYAADKTIGYSQDTRMHNPNMDCSSFVWYCLTDSGAVPKETLGGSPFTTDTSPALLKAAGFEEHTFTSVDALEPGDVLWRSGHMELYYGEHEGVKYGIGAHSAYGRPENGDQKQEGDSWIGGEVGATPCTGRFERYYRPTASMLEGTGQDYKSSTAAQKRIVDATKVTPDPGAGLCATWVSHVYTRAGLPRPGGNANDMWAQYCTSNKRSDLKVGMIVAVQHSGATGNSWRYGHVGIYIGDGMITHSTGTVLTESVDSWISKYDPYNTVKWGFGPGVA